MTNNNIAIGIDLGTTYSCVGVWKDGSVEIIANDQGSRTTPSYVAFTDHERLIGQGAKNQAASNPENTIFDAKRLIGRRYSDPYCQNDIKLFPFKVVSDSNDKPIIKARYKEEEKEFKPEESCVQFLIFTGNLVVVGILFTQSLKLLELNLPWKVLPRCLLMKTFKRFRKFTIGSTQIENQRN